MSRTIYLDHNSTTPVDPRVLEAMLPYFSEEFGNPSSRTHPFGWKAEEAVEVARQHVAAALGCQPREIIFTSGATEANNIAIFGTAQSLRARGNHIVTSAVEHHAVLDPCRKLAAGWSPAGTSEPPFEVTYLRPDRHGRISAAQVHEAINERTILVSIMAANNEIGTIYPLAEIGAVCKERGVLFHTDAAQAFGKIGLSLEDLDVDLLSISGHKLYGPKGVGALFVRTKSPRLRLTPLSYGGGQERDLRPGTLNVPGIVGLGVASKIASAELDEEAGRVLRLRQRFHEGITARLEGVRLNGPLDGRLPGNLNLSFEGLQGEALLVELKDLSVSSGSACTSSSPEPSYVLRAIGVTMDLAHASIRFGFGRFNTASEIDYAIEKVVTTVNRLREISSAVSQ